MKTLVEVFRERRKDSVITGIFMAVVFWLMLGLLPELMIVERTIMAVAFAIILLVICMEFQRRYT